jgi:hypothetical protein
VIEPWQQLIQRRLEASTDKYCYSNAIKILRQLRDAYRATGTCPASEHTSTVYETVTNAKRHSSPSSTAPTCGASIYRTASATRRRSASSAFQRNRSRSTTTADVTARADLTQTRRRYLTKSATHQHRSTAPCSVSNPGARISRCLKQRDAGAYRMINDRWRASSNHKETRAG